MVQNTDRCAQAFAPEAETLGRDIRRRSPLQNRRTTAFYRATQRRPVAVRKPVPGLTNRGEVLARRLAEICFSFEAEKRSSLRSHPARLFTLGRLPLLAH